MTRALAALVLALLLAGCASFRPTRRSRSTCRRRVTASTSWRWAGTNRQLFVIVAFSGGGTRAAALGYGVMEELRATRIGGAGGNATLLDEVDVISSVSGGSFTAAYYALRGEKLFDEFPDLFLYRPIQSELVREMLLPSSWPKLAGASYGRSDLAAEFYDRELFRGAAYAELIARKTRPFVVLNATDMTTGTPFPFLQDQFDLMCSDLAGVPLARAVASSSAFPGLLTPLTFRNYAGSCEYRQPSWVQIAIDDTPLRLNARRRAIAENRLSLAAAVEAKPARPYIHLTDGGVADNIGLRGPLDALSSPNHPWSVVQMMNNGPIEKLVVIAVNAATGALAERDQSASVPGLIDTVVTAADVPLGNYSFDTVELLGKAAQENARDARLVEQCNRLSAAKGAQCALELPSARKVDFYPVQVAFEYIASAEERAWFRSLPTTFELPADTVTKLRAVARRLLAEDPQFQKLLKDLRNPG
jgi:predicted acylesterase/phospholipase RssA